MKYSDGTYNFEWDGGEMMSVYTMTGEHLFDHEMCTGFRFDNNDNVILTRPDFTLENMKMLAEEAAELVCEEYFWPHINAIAESDEID